MPQPGLIPLGHDPHSGLQEFALWGLGSVPARESPGGMLRLADDFAPVLVLVPGGRVRLGCQASDPAAPRFDPDAERQDLADVAVELAPFLIGKHELTRRQWLSLGGAPLREAPSARFLEEALAGDRHPATHIGWERVVELLARHGLLLPTEAQWERAARGGTDTPWWFGDDPAFAALAGNTCDAMRRGDCGGKFVETTINDGFEYIAPVDSGLPNPFGLHGMVGNAFDLCRDVYLTGYRGRLRPGDGLHEPGAQEQDLARRSLRGGSALDPVGMSRSAARCDVGVDQPHVEAGVRLVRPLVGGAARGP